MNGTALARLALLAALATASAPSRAAELNICSLVTAAEYTAIVGTKLDAAPGGSGSACTATFNGYRSIAQLQVVEGFGESDRYAGLVKFWRGENAKSRARGNQISETSVGTAFCESKREAFVSPTTRCMRELPGKRVLYATISSTIDEGTPPPVDRVMKLLDTATPRARGGS